MKVVKQTPQGTVWSCRTASESFGQLSIALLLLTPRAKTTEHLAGFFLLATDRVTRDTLLGLNGLSCQKTPSPRYTPWICRTALIERLLKDWVQRWNKAQFISESIRQAHLV
jgi:hypothetical protein